MTRSCLGYINHDCTVSLEGEHVLRKRCAPCKAGNDKAMQKSSTAKRKAKLRPCLGYDGHTCAEQIKVGKRCKPCSKVNKHNYDIAFQKRGGRVVVSNADNVTRLSLYLSWQSCARYWGDVKAEKLWAGKRKAMLSRDMRPQRTLKKSDAGNLISASILVDIYDLSPAQGRMMEILASGRLLTARGFGCSDSSMKVQISGIRKVLPTGLSVKTIWHEGYQCPPETCAKLKEIMSGKLNQTIGA